MGFVQIMHSSGVWDYMGTWCSVYQKLLACLSVRHTFDISASNFEPYFNHSDKILHGNWSRGRSWHAEARKDVGTAASIFTQSHFTAPRHSQAHEAASWSLATVIILILSHDRGNGSHAAVTFCQALFSKNRRNHRRLNRDLLRNIEPWLTTATSASPAFRLVSTSSKPLSIAS
jgi:hypothetical protein